MTTILAIDPGNVTGAALLYPNASEPETWEVPDGLDGFVRWYNMAVFADEVWMEQFTINAETHKKTREMAALHIIGYVLGTNLLRGTPTKMVLPRDHKRFSQVPSKTSKIARLGWGERTKDGHSDDACSILLYALTKPAHYERLSQLLGGIL